MSKVGRVSLLEQQADQLEKVINETVVDEPARQDAGTALRALTQEAALAIMNAPDAERQ
jgi:hypothetical protein